MPNHGGIILLLHLNIVDDVDAKQCGGEAVDDGGPLPATLGPSVDISQCQIMWW